MRIIEDNYHPMLKRCMTTPGLSVEYICPRRRPQQRQSHPRPQPSPLGLRASSSDLKWKLKTLLFPSHQIYIILVLSMVFLVSLAPRMTPSKKSGMSITATGSSSPHSSITGGSSEPRLDRAENHLGWRRCLKWVFEREKSHVYSSKRQQHLKFLYICGPCFL